MASTIPENLLYTKDHEWALIEGNVATVGITDHAQHQLGDVVYLELPSKGSHLNQHSVFGVVESVKAVSDLFAPLSGEVLETNTPLTEHPEKINQNPYQLSWMIKIQLSSQDELKGLMDHKAYAHYLHEEAK